MDGDYPQARKVARANRVEYDDIYNELRDTYQWGHDTAHEVAQYLSTGGNHREAMEATLSEQQAAGAVRLP